MTRDGITRMSLRALRDMGANLGGFALTGDIYYYENDLSRLASLEPLGEDERQLPYDTDRVNEVISEIKKRFPGASSCSRYQIAYSCGMYGNTGQLHRLEVLDKDWEHLGDVFTYTA